MSESEKSPERRQDAGAPAVRNQPALIAPRLASGGHGPGHRRNTRHWRKVSIAAAIIGGLTLLPMSCLGQKLEPKDPPVSKVDEWKVGGKSTLRITLVTADYAGFMLYDKEFAASTREQERNGSWPRDPNQPLEDNKANVIQPYRTWNDNRLAWSRFVGDPRLATRCTSSPLGNPCPRSWRVSSHSATASSADGTAEAEVGPQLYLNPDPKATT